MRFLEPFLVLRNVLLLLKETLLRLREVRPTLTINREDTIGQDWQTTNQARFRLLLKHHSIRFQGTVLNNCRGCLALARLVDGIPSLRHPSTHVDQLILLGLILG